MTRGELPSRTRNMVCNLVKHFPTKDEAQLWAGEQERNIRLAGLPLTIDKLQKHTIREIVEKYRDEKVIHKRAKATETAALNKFLHDISRPIRNQRLLHQMFQEALSGNRYSYTEKSHRHSSSFSFPSYKLPP